MTFEINHVSPWPLARDRWRMPRAEYDKMKEWCESYGEHERVLRWLSRNPLHSRWEGTPTEWAWLNMPFAPGTFLGDLLFVF